MKKINFLLILSLFSSLYALADVEIVGGEPVLIAERPYQVSLQNSNRDHVCGGALIADNWVLTAAHCLPHIVNGSAVVGTTKLSTGVTRININDAIPYNADSLPVQDGVDIALIKLASAAPAHLTRLKLPTSSILQQVGNAEDTATVSGWGSISQNGPGSDHLKKTNVPIVSNDVCSQAYVPGGRSHQIRPTTVCAGFELGGIDSCQGDSGGPLTVAFDGEDYSLGVVSWGIGCAQARLYGVYARTLPFVSWIESRTGVLGKRPPIVYHSDETVTCPTGYDAYDPSCTRLSNPTHLGTFVYDENGYYYYGILDSDASAKQACEELGYHEAFVEDTDVVLFISGVPNEELIRSYMRYAGGEWGRSEAIPAIIVRKIRTLKCLAKMGIGISEADSSRGLLDTSLCYISRVCTTYIHPRVGAQYVDERAANMWCARNLGPDFNVVNVTSYSSDPDPSTVVVTSGTEWVLETRTESSLPVLRSITCGI